MRRETLEKMRGWIESEQVKGKKPRAEPFTLMSLAFCAYKVADEAQAEEALEVLYRVAKEQHMLTYALVSPIQALFLIERALTTK